MTAVLLAYAPAFAVASLLLLAAVLCRRLERYYARRAAAVLAEHNARPHSARVGTAALAHQSIRDGWTDPTTEDRAA